MSAPVKHADNENVDDLSFYAPPGARRVLRPTPQQAPAVEASAAVAEAAKTGVEEPAPSRSSQLSQDMDSPPTAPPARPAHLGGREQPPHSDKAPEAPTARMPLGLGSPNLESPRSLAQPPKLTAARPAALGDSSGRDRPAPPRPRLFEGDVLIKAVWQRLAGDPDLIPEPPLQQERRPTVVPMLLRTSLLVAVAGCIALVVTLVSLPDSRPSALKQDKAMIAAIDPFGDASTYAVFKSARLIVEGRQAFANEPLPLGVSIEGAAGGEFAMFTGLAAGTRFSLGAPFGGGGWRLPARDLTRAVAYAPHDFVGVMNTAIDLRTGNDALVDSQIMRLEWVPKRLGMEEPARQPRLDREEVRSVAAVQALDPEELATLMRRGQDYMRTGDLAAARLVLRRAASAADAQAALALGATFDPLVLEELGVLGVRPDPVQARAWYERAAQLGSPEARRRLARLLP